MADLVLQLSDVHGDPLGEQVDIRLQHHTLAAPRLVRSVARKTLRIADLIGPPQGLYSIYIDPPSYLPVSQFVRLTSARTRATFVFPVDPVKVRAVTFPPFGDLHPWMRSLLERSGEVVGFIGAAGADLYDGLDTIRRAGLLNVSAKCEATPLGDGTTVADHLARATTQIVGILGDRTYAVIDAAFFGECRNALARGLLREVPGGLHHPPRPGYALARSYKSDDHYGNLQLTFFTDGSGFIVDIDIDDAGGLAHLFQVARNALSGRPTHPFDIHEILIRHQKVDPAYSFQLA